MYADLRRPRDLPLKAMPTDVRWTALSEEKSVHLICVFATRHSSAHRRTSGTQLLPSSTDGNVRDRQIIHVCSRC